MCTVCGCGKGETRIENKAHDHTHHEHHHHDHDHHHHDHDHHHHHEHLHFGEGVARSHAPGMTQSKMVQIEADIMSKNDQYAANNRNFFQSHDILSLNLVSSPGSGKTTLLAKTLRDLKKQKVLSVIEGDQETSNDAEKIRATGIPAIQINTGKGCHLDAHQIGHAVENLKPHDNSVLFIENVGNLVCPAGFDLGEHAKVAILSVTEGEDKPIKYPDMFHAAELIIINKIDLLPYLDFDLELCEDYIRRVNPDAEILTVSATTGEGMAEWYDWITQQQSINAKFA